MRESWRGVPLRPTLVSVVVGLILVASGAVGVIAYVSAHRTVDEMWRRLSDRIAHVSAERVLRYFHSARPYVSMTGRLARSGRISPERPEELLVYLRSAVEANPEFTWASFSGEDGTYLAAYRDQEGELHATWRTVEADGTRFRELELGPEGWQVESERMGDYDPRKRPWYKKALASEEPVWVEPFLFATVKKPGFMFVSRHVEEGEVRGVWAVEYEVSYLSGFLASLRVGDTGTVYLVTEGGRVVGHPAGQVAEEREGEIAIARAAGHPDDRLDRAFRELERRGGGSVRFEVGPYLVMAEPLPEDSGIGWLTLVVVPKDELFAGVRRQAWLTAAVALAAALIAVLLGVFFSTRVSGALRNIAGEMDRVGRFDLEDPKGGPPGRSAVREVNLMRDATARMKKSLRSFGRYVPRDLVRELITSGEEAVVGGRRAELSILFSDLVGFTSLSERMDADDLAELITEYFEAASGAIRREGGTLDKYIGDAVMAFWGAPNEHPGHAAAACRAALAMIDALEELASGWEARGLPRLSIRIGINTGQVVVGNVGSRERLNYTAFGDSVNLASRLEALGKRYGATALLGEATARQVEEEMLLRPIDYVAVAGKEEPVVVYELLGTREGASESEVRGAERYAEALELYRSRDFARAAEIFSSLAEAGDVPAGVLLERCRLYAAEPPPEDWDGRHVMLEK